MENLWLTGNFHFILEYQILSTHDRQLLHQNIDAALGLKTQILYVEGKETNDESFNFMSSTLKAYYSHRLYDVFD